MSFLGFSDRGFRSVPAAQLPAALRKNAQGVELDTFFGVTRDPIQQLGIRNPLIRFSSQMVFIQCYLSHTINNKSVCLKVANYSSEHIQKGFK